MMILKFQFKIVVSNIRKLGALTVRLNYSDQNIQQVTDHPNP